jgi:hypothetical protein
MSESNQLVPQIGNADLVEVETTTVPDLATAVGQLQNLLGDMRPDDFSLELEVDRIRTKLRLRAYRHRSNGRS